MIKRLCLLLLCAPAATVAGACTSTTNVVAAPATDSGTTPPDDDGGTPTDATTGGTMCSKARDDLLIPIDKVSTGNVTIVSDSGGTKILYVDAMAGGIDQAIHNPRIYVDLGAGTRVGVTDATAPMSTAWDLALKRDVIFTNSGDAGMGVGGGVEVDKSFASVTATEAMGAKVAAEKFFDGDCNPQLDQTGAPNTTFAGWYNYDQTTNIPTPKDITYVVVGGTGKRYKVGIKSYAGLPDGGTGVATGAFVLQVAAL